MNEEEIINKAIEKLEGEMEVLRCCISSLKAQLKIREIQKLQGGLEDE